MRNTTADLLVQELIRHKVDTVFAMPGDQLNALFFSLHKYRHTIRAIHPRTESAASYMAYGYAKATGRPGVMIVPPGPGVLNALAGIAVGYATSTPMLCITGQVPLNAIGARKGALHELPDQLATLRTLTKWAERLQRSSDTLSVVGRVFEYMLSGRQRPVALEIPPDVLSAEANVTGENTQGILTRFMPPIDASAVKSVANLLRQAKHPLIVVGGGAIRAADSIAAFSKLTQIPVTSNSGGRGIVSARSELALTWPAAHKLWPDVDVVLAIGTRLAQPRTQWGIDDSLQIIRVDIDPVELEDLRPSDIGLLADAAEFTEELLLHCSANEWNDRRDELRSLQTQVLKEFSAISPQQDYIDAIRSALPDDAIIVDELTQIGYCCRYGLPVYQPGTYITSGYQGALGYGFSAALGAKVAFPNRAVLSINGDGGFMYGSAELGTAVQQRLGIIAIIFNDGQFGNVAREQLASGYSIATELYNPQFTTLAAAYGVHAKQVVSPSDLALAIREAKNRELPTVIEVPVAAMPSPWHLIRLPNVRTSSGERPL